MLQGRTRYARYAGLLLLVAGLAWWLLCLPATLFDAPYSAVARAKNGTLLGARVAADGQWRLPATDTLDERYARAVLLFEDEYFHYHLGVNPVSVVRAFRQNLRAGRTVSGASTITMQTVRLMRAGQPRSWAEKAVELAWATRLELSYRKAEILGLYAAHAPFGGNVVGIEAASWRYYGRAPTSLSWAEAAALAVLPNAPGVIYPGRSSTEFLRKRNGLLDKLHARGELDDEELVLAKAEPLPAEPHTLPNLAPHALVKLNASNGASHLRTQLQETTLRAVARQHERQRENGVHGAAAIIVEVASGHVIAYVGNTDCTEPGAQSQVDVVQGHRSSGSVLKPFLYGALLDAGRISPHTLVPDIPSAFGSYAPQNFDLTFDGAVPAGEALTRSLNVPHVRLLQEFGVAPTLRLLREVGFSTLDRSAGNYGLSLILGGGEVTLLDVASAYRGLAHTVLHYEEADRTYSSNSYAQAVLAGELAAGVEVRNPPLSAGAAYLTLETLTELTRPGDLASWRTFAGGRRVAWKTGTSWGHRDAWAVGVTPEYVVAVWTGNPSGEGRAGLTGASAAAPLLFEVFDALPRTSWFVPPVEDMVGVELCMRSGMRAGTQCPNPRSMLLPVGAKRLAGCSFHSIVFVDDSGQRVDATCAQLATAHRDTAFVLPPAWAHYYRKTHPAYRGMPPWADACTSSSSATTNKMALVYPRGGSQLKLPRDLAGHRQPVVFEVAHPNAQQSLHWYLDGGYAGTTRGPHQQPLAPETGRHALTVIDEAGGELRWYFEVL